MQNLNKLNLLIEKLNKDEFSAVTITDANTSNVLYNTITSNEIKEKFTDAESLFNSIYETGNTKLIIQEKRKNGSTYKSVATSFFIEMVSNSNIETPQPQQETQVFAKNNNILQQENKMFGLGQLDVINLLIESKEAKRFQNENEILKTENKKLEAENKELKEKELKDKYDADKESSRNQLITGLMSQAPQIVAGLKGVFAPSVGLAGATENLHPINNIEPATKDILFLINEELIKNADFQTEFFELLKKYQLWQ